VLIDVKNPKLYSEWLEYIQDADVKAAFLYLIGLAACSRRFRCNIQWKGEVRDFRFHECSGEQPYSFITNQRWLLFYFRASAVRSDHKLRQTLSKVFDSFEENSAGEWTIKLRSISDVGKLTRRVRF
jgi:hypothetical protein